MRENGAQLASSTQKLSEEELEASFTNIERLAQVTADRVKQLEQAARLRTLGRLHGTS